MAHIEQESFPFDFGMRLKQLREDRYLSQAAVAKRVEVSKNTIYRYENNLQEPTRDKLIKLAIIFNTSLDYICGLSDKKPFAIYNLTEKQQQILLQLIESLHQQKE